VSSSAEWIRTQLLLQSDGAGECPIGCIATNIVVAVAQDLTAIRGFHPVPFAVTVDWPTRTMAACDRLVESKGRRPLLAAHERLGQRGRDIRLLIAGLPDPANPTSIRRRRSKPGLGDPTSIFSASWKISGPSGPAHTSRYCRPTLSLLEAAACGRPLVATDVPGCREIACLGVNAFLVPLDDTEALAEAIDRLALDPQLRRKFGKAGRKLVELKFSSQRIGRDVVTLYRHLLGQTD
jgi:Glycosyl transferases group 1